MEKLKQDIWVLLKRFRDLGIAGQIDYEKFYLYSIITHSTAIEGSTVTEIENRLLFDEGISAAGRTMQEQLMNLDLKAAYEQSQKYARSGEPVTKKMLCELSALVLKNTGSVVKALGGTFDASKGELRLCNVSAGISGPSYLSFQKVPQRFKEFCEWLNTERARIAANTIEAYDLSFRAHYRLVSIHPWVDGNGRMSRLLMNQLQWEKGLLPTIVYKEHKAAYIESLAKAQEEENECFADDERKGKACFDSAEQGKTCAKGEDIFCKFMYEELKHFLTQSISDFEKGQERDVPVNVPVNVPVKLTERQREIIRLMQDNSAVTLQQVAGQLNVNEKTIKRDVAVLREQGIVSREGSDKSGLWRVSL